MKIKNRLLNVFLVLVVSFAFVGEVFAADFEVSASADNTTVAKGSEILIKVNLKANEPISDCKFNFSSDESKLEYISMTGTNAWSVDMFGSKDVLISRGVENNVVAPTEGLNIVQLKYRVKDSGDVTIKTIQCVSVQNDNSYDYQDVVVSIVATEPVEEDTTLKELVVTNGIMEPSTITGTDASYVVVLSSSNFGLSMTTTDPAYQNSIVVKDENGNVIEDPGNITFKDDSGRGEMPLTITVNDTTTYQLFVVYIDKQYDNSLQSVTINGEELTLVEGQYNYQVPVEVDVTFVDVAVAIRDNENFKFGSLTNAPGQFSIVDVVNVIIEVEPKDSSLGAEKATYTIEITRKGSEQEEKPSVNPGNSSKPSGNTGVNTNKNPSTGGPSMYLMAFILIISLIGSVVLYRKNMEGYK